MTNFTHRTSSCLLHTKPSQAKFSSQGHPSCCAFWSPAARNTGVQTLFPSLHSGRRLPAPLGVGLQSVSQSSECVFPVCPSNAPCRGADCTCPSLTSTPGCRHGADVCDTQWCSQVADLPLPPQAAVRSIFSMPSPSPQKPQSISQGQSLGYVDTTAGFSPQRQSAQ